MFQVAKWGVREDYGKEYCLTLFFTEKYSLLQVSFDVGEYGNWIEFPYTTCSTERSYGNCGIMRNNWEAK